jgi:hypothetical protein
MMNRFIGTSFSLALLFSLASPMTFAADYASVRRIADAYLDVEPPDMVAPVKISREELKAELDAGKTITLVDALPEKYFTLSHLANSINIPFEQADKAERLLPNKTAEIIVYCMDRK